MTDLMTHEPGDAIAAKTLEVQSTYRARPLLARLLGASPLGEESRPWYWGVLGEQAVGRELARLGPEWTVLHSVPVGKKDSDVDHVVIGPRGIFTINTKNHSGQSVWVAGGTFMVAGHRKNHVRDARHEATRAAKLLGAAASAPLTVQGVIVVVDPKKLNVKEQPSDVTVVTARRLVRWLQKRPVLLSPEQVAWVVEASRRPQTWSTKAPAELDLAAMRSAFAALCAEIASARRVRLTWVLGLMASIVTFLLTGGLAAVFPWLTSVLTDVLLPTP